MLPLKNGLKIFFIVTTLIAINGCAEIDPFEAPGEVIRHPLGSESIRIGMSREEIISKWGDPDMISKLAVKDASGSQREEWVYKARRYVPVPLDKAYMHKNKYLYFDGNNLTRISDDPQSNPNEN